MRITAFAILLVVAGSAHGQPANRPTLSAKASPATAPVKDEAAQRKLDDAAAAGQQKLADENSHAPKPSGRRSCVASALDARGWAFVQGGSSVRRSSQARILKS